VGLSIRKDKEVRLGSTSKPSNLGVTNRKSAAPPTRTVVSMMLTFATVPEGTLKSFFAKAGAAAPIKRIELSRMFNAVSCGETFDGFPVM